MTSFAETAKGLLRPFVPRFVMEARRRRIFFESRGWQNLHWGVYPTFEDARDYALQSGASTRFGEAHEEMLRRHAVMKPHDYPVLYWLSRILPEVGAGRLVDLGGSVGSTYYAYQNRLPLPDGLIWMVCELSEVAELGRKIALDRDAPHLRFTDDFAQLDGARVLFSAGCLQYLERPLADMLAELAQPPEHVVINRTALTSNDAYVTLQNTGFSISPCRVDNIGDYIARMAALGYRAVDTWKCLGNYTEVPFHPECALPYFTGIYFRRVGTGPLANAAPA